MSAPIRVRTTVLPGSKVEVSVPGLTEGQQVEVVVTLPATPPAPLTKANLLEWLDSLPPGPRSYPTWEEFERTFQEERNSWDC